MSLPWLSDPRRPMVSPRELPNLAAWFDALDTRTMLAGDGSVITDGGAVALWADKSGNSGVNCLVLPGVTGNFAEVPDEAGIPRGDFYAYVDMRLPDYTPASEQVLVAHWNSTGNQRSFYWYLDITTGRIGSAYSADGTNVGYAVANADVPWSDFQRVKLKLRRVSSTGVVTYWYRFNDGDAWTQVGADRNSGITGNLFDTTAGFRVGQTTAGPATGIFYSASINSDETTQAIGIDFSQSTKKLANGDTFTCATGQTVTLNSSGATGARIAGERDYFMGTAGSRGTYNAAGRYIATDGTDDYYKTALFSLPQPVTVYAVMEQTTWTSGDYLIDGSASDTLALIQTTSTPQINLSAGSSVAANTDLAVATKAVVTIVSNGASSLVSINRLAATTGNAGAGVPNGLTLASKGTAGSYGNAKWWEFAVYRGAHDQATRHRWALYAGRRHGIAV